jgi:hypothetical protein
MELKTEDLDSVNYAIPLEPELIQEPEHSNEPTYCICSQVSFGEMIGMALIFFF